VKPRASALALSMVLVSVPVGADLGFLGPRGTFSDEAAELYRRAVPDVGATVPFETMTAVVDALRAGRISRGMIPVASTVAGFPEESQRLLLSEPDPGFRVVAEVVVPVELHLLVKPGASRAGIRRILSHPNALGEAGRFLATSYPGATREETSSTAAAAERVRDGDGSLAAVASSAAARLYELEILERFIQEDSLNATSFWAIARTEDAPEPREASRLALLLEAPSGSDALSATVASLHDAGLDVVFVSSAPLPGEIYGFRYLLSLSAEKPVASDRISTAIGSDAAAGGRVLPLGWWSPP
jgi:prephenate dehydratase